MARSSIPVTRLTFDDSGVDPTSTEVASDSVEKHYVENNGRVILQVRNEDTVSRTVTFETTHTVDGLAVADRTLTIAAGVEKYVGPFPRSIYNDGSEHLLVDPSTSSVLKFRAFRF